MRAEGTIRAMLIAMLLFPVLPQRHIGLGFIVADVTCPERVVLHLLCDLVLLHMTVKLVLREPHKGAVLARQVGQVGVPGHPALLLLTKAPSHQTFS